MKMLKRYYDEYKVVFYMVLIAITLRTFAYEPFRIPSGSMIPTLLVGDYLFVSKLSYGYSHYSLPFDLPLINGRILFKEPKRGDVAVFRLPTDPKVDYIKRLVGLPGDTIQLRNSVLYVNGKPVEYTRVDDFVDKMGNGSVNRIVQFEETLPGGKVHNTIERTGNTAYDTTPVYTVPEGHYFGMGDNRDGSKDSRFLDHVGYIPRENLIGRADLIFFSVDGSPWKFWEWPKTLRVGRFFKDIE